MVLRHLTDQPFKLYRVVAGAQHVAGMVQVDLKLAGRGFRQRAVGGNVLLARQRVDIAQHRAEVIEIIHRVDLALHIAFTAARRARRLNIALGVAGLVNQIELQLYRYHRKESSVAQLLPQPVQDIAGFNVKGSAILVAHGQQQLSDARRIGSRGN